jgi:hypothetical protein
VLTAVLFGLAASSALVIGAVVGAYWRPPKPLLAAALAFASGALITALAFDLFQESFKRGGAWLSRWGFLAGRRPSWLLTSCSTAIAKERTECEVTAEGIRELYERTQTGRIKRARGFVDHNHLTSKQNALCGRGCEWSRLMSLEVTLTLHAHGHTAGFNVDTRAFASIPARHDVWRRVTFDWLAGMAVTGVVDQEDAKDMAHEFAYGLAKRTYGLERKPVEKA